MASIPAGAIRSDDLRGSFRKESPLFFTNSRILQRLPCRSVTFAPTRLTLFTYLPAF